MVMVIFEIKITVFTCLLNSDGCDSFPKHLDLAPATNKTNKGVEKQWTTQYYDKLWHTVTCLVAFKQCTFSLVYWRLGIERGRM